MTTRCAPEIVRCHGVAMCRAYRSASSSMRATGFPLRCQSLEFEVDHFARNAQVDQRQPLGFEGEVLGMTWRTVQDAKPAGRKQLRTSEAGQIAQIKCEYGRIDGRLHDASFLEGAPLQVPGLRP